MRPILPPGILTQHIAVLGKTGSGKTSTTKLIIEQITRSDPDARVCILDPIKSDHWGLTLAGDGKAKGLPFYILGGPYGHVPLNAAAGDAIGKLVASGALRHSIIDMADFDMGDHARFFMAFAHSLFRNMKGVLWLVVEEAHTFAPKEKAGFGEESKATYWMKKLATGSRSKGIRLVVATQRTQELHNAVLGSCETLIVHRVTLPADQKPVMDWLKSNVDKERVEGIAATLSSLKTGEAWICSGEAQITERRTFPRITTYDNSATPTGDAANDVKPAPVDVAGLEKIIGGALAEAKANDPTELKRQIVALKKQLASKQGPTVEKVTEVPSRQQAQIIRNLRKGLEEAMKVIANINAVGFDKVGLDAEQVKKVIETAAAQIVKMVEVDQAKKIAEIGKLKREASALLGKLQKLLETDTTTVDVAVERSESITVTPLVAKTPKGAVGAVSEGLSSPEQRILDSLAFWEVVGVKTPNNAATAAKAMYSPTSSGYANPRGALCSKGLVTYPQPDHVALTEDGRKKANHPDEPGTLRDLHNSILEILPTPQQRILRVLIEAYPNALTNEATAKAAGYSETSSGYANPRGNLRSIGLIEYRNGGVAATEILFPASLSL